MSALTASPVQDDDDHPWWSSPSFLIPIGSGIALVSGAVCTWAGVELSGQVLFWIRLAPAGDDELITTDHLHTTTSCILGSRRLDASTPRRLDAIVDIGRRLDSTVYIEGYA